MLIRKTKVWTTLLGCLVVGGVLGSMLVTATEAAPQVAVPIRNDLRFYTGFAQGAKWGPGEVNNSNAGAGAGPWYLFVNPAPGGVPMTMNLSVQNTGTQTAEIFVDSGGPFLSLAGGQSASYPLSLGTGQILYVRFIGAGNGSIIWVGR